jgi:hypothetical protein
MTLDIRQKHMQYLKSNQEKNKIPHLLPNFFIFYFLFFFICIFFLKTNKQKNNKDMLMEKEMISNPNM